MNTTHVLGAWSFLGCVGLVFASACATPDESSDPVGDVADEEAAGDEEVAQSQEAWRIGGPIGVPQKCGSNTCGQGTFCCNASCGTCAPLGGACTQQVCASAE